MLEDAVTTGDLEDFVASEWSLETVSRGTNLQKNAVNNQPIANPLKRAYGVEVGERHSAEVCSTAKSWTENEPTSPYRPLRVP